MPGPMSFLPKLTGSFSSPAADNPTVAMVEAAYRYHGIDARYINCEVPPDLLGDAVSGARAMGWLGFNCSLPHKVAVIPHLDSLGSSAKIIGAVNCTVNRDGALIGENTDGKGFLTALRTLTDPQGSEVVLFGAGGAARAIAVELALAGAARVTVVNRDASRGRQLASLIDEKTDAGAGYAAWDGTCRVPEKASIVVNATSIGLAPDLEARLDIDTESLQPHMTVADVIPNPPRTHLIRDAEARGCTTLDGLGMLVNQGVIGIEHWTGIAVDPTVMRAKLEEIFGV